MTPAQPPPPDPPPSSGARIGRAIAGAIFLFIGGFGFGQGAWMTHVRFSRLLDAGYLLEPKSMPFMALGLVCSVLGFALAKSGRGIFSIGGVLAGIFALVIAVYGLVEKEAALFAFSGVLDIAAAVGMAMNDDPPPRAR
jgi:hypothetical protein